MGYCNHDVHTIFRDALQHLRKLLLETRKQSGAPSDSTGAKIFESRECRGFVHQEICIFITRVIRIEKPPHARPLPPHRPPPPLPPPLAIPPPRYHRHRPWIESEPSAAAQPRRRRYIATRPRWDSGWGSPSPPLPARSAADPRRHTSPPCRSTHPGRALAASRLRARSTSGMAKPRRFSSVA